jgi:hypothetical protein
LRAAVGKIHIFFGFSKNSTKTSNTSERRIVCRYRLESTWGLFAGYGRDGWRMQKKTSRTNEYGSGDLCWTKLGFGFSAQHTQSNQLLAECDTLDRISITLSIKHTLGWAGISLGPLRWLEDAEETRTNEYDRLDASVD